MRKAVAPMIGFLMAVALLLAALGIVLGVVMPILEDIQDGAALDSSISNLNDLDTVIRQVAREGRGATRSFTFSNRRGSFRFDQGANAILYELQTSTDAVSTRSMSQQGAVTLSVGRDVSVRETSINGSRCYMMENRHLEACVRRIYETFDPRRHPDLSGFWRFNESTGQILTDSSLAGRDGVQGSNTSVETADPIWTDGIYRSGLNVSGDRFATLADAFPDSGGFTVSMWVRPVNGSGTLYDMGTSGDYLFLAMDNGTVQWFFEDENGNDVRLNASLDDPAGRWHHVVGTGEWDGGMHRLFLDGEEMANSTVSIDGNPGLTAPLVGVHRQRNEAGQTKQNLSGLVDEVRVYNRSLTPNEVRWQALQEGDTSYVAVSELLVWLYNKHLETAIDPSIELRVDGNANTSTGTGYTEPETIGDEVPRGRVTARVETGTGAVYDLHIDLLTGADFLSFEVE